MPAKKKAAPKKLGAGKLRGVALMERVIAELEAEGGTLGGCGIPKHKAKGLPPAKLARLALPDGRPPPASLVRFLAYDETYLGVLDRKGQLACKSFGDMMLAEFDERTRDMYSDFARVLTAPCLVIPGGSDSRRFVYFGQADEHGEYPVFIVDTDELPFVCIAYPGFDVYMADGTVANVIQGTYTDGSRHRTYGPAIREQAKRNFHGFISICLGDDPEPETIDGRPSFEVLGELFGDSPLGEFAAAMDEYDE